MKEDIRLDVNYAPEVEVEEYFIHARYTANAYRQTTDKLMFKSVISTVR